MTGTSKDRRAALGVRCHSGWAAIILAAATANDIQVLERRRIELCDASIEGAKQPFHTAEPMPFARAERFIERCRASTDERAEASVKDLLREGIRRKITIVSCGLLCASGRGLPPLRGILASHALIHAAEGEFYRDAIASACGREKLRVIRIRERDAILQAADQTGLKDAELKKQLSTIGKSLGPPWTEDQKLAAAAAWIALLC